MRHARRATRHAPRATAGDVVLAEETLAQVESRAQELQCTHEIHALPELLRRGGGARLQPATYEVAGMDAVLRQLTELTAAPAAPAGGSS